MGHACYVWGWRRLLRDLGVRASLVALTRLFLVSNLGRYLPGGKAWQMAILATMAGEHALPPARVAASSLVQGVVGMGVGVLVLIAAGGSALGFSRVWLALSAAGVVALLLLPASLRARPRLAAFVARRIPGIEAVSWRTMWALVWTTAGSWVWWGVALHALGRGVLTTPSVPLLTAVTAWTGSFLAGILVLIAPAGVGAREGVMQAVLARASVSAADILILVVLARVGATVLDVIPAMIMLAWRQRRGGAMPAAADRGAS